MTFEAINGQLFLRHMALRVTVTQAQADAYCTLFWEQGLMTTFNDLCAAMKAADYVPWARSVVVDMLQASVRTLEHRWPAVPFDGAA